MIKNGIIVIDKEKGMTSHDVVGRVRRIVGVRRVGHTGTLDPMAEGVLPVCVGRATRVVEYLDTDLKKYSCRMLFGRKTNTYDMTGEVMEEADPEDVDSLDPEKVEEELLSIKGHLKQLPPIYSAVKVDGKRLYEYARKGRDVDIPERDVYIESVEIKGMELGKGLNSSLTFDVVCSKGTFIRSICNDLGEKLGVHGALDELRRIASGSFTIDEAVSLDELKDMSEEEMDERFLCADEALDKFGIAVVKEKDAIRLINGLEIEGSVFTVDKEPYFKENSFYFPVRDEYREFYRVYSLIEDMGKIPGRPQGEEVSAGSKYKGMTFVGICRRDPETNHLHPEKIFV